VVSGGGVRDACSLPGACILVRAGFLADGRVWGGVGCCSRAFCLVWCGGWDWGAMCVSLALARASVFLCAVMWPRGVLVVANSAAVLVPDHVLLRYVFWVGETGVAAHGSSLRFVWVDCWQWGCGRFIHLWGRDSSECPL